VEIVRLDDTLHVLVASSAGVQHHGAGSWSATERKAEFARSALRRLAQGAAGRQERIAAATSIGAALERDVLGSAAEELGDGPVVLSPPASLHHVPWGLLPSLDRRAFSVSPSGTMWRRSRQLPPPGSRTVTLIAGPELKGCGSEVAALAAYYGDVELLLNGTATVANALSALDGRWLVHVAAHGEFRADNPLFSSLAMDDGPLTLLDLQRLTRAPYRLVVSSCNSGAGAVAGSDELLGLFSALAPLGTGGMLAAVIPISDAASPAFAMRIHDRLRAGWTTAEALLHARGAATDHPADFATARSFLALGAV
jgi:hypothetical protein